MEDTESEGAMLEKQDQAYLQSVKQFVQEDPPGDPTTYRQATEGGDSEKWETAMKEEIDSLEKMGTWKVVPLPEGRKPITCKWVYRTKRDADGNPMRYKARLVARGFSQVYGKDYMETHAPVTRLETIRLLLVIACMKDREVKQFDVKSAYLYGELEEEIFMEPPPGYNVPEGFVLLLVKALYELKQAGRQWYKTLSETLRKHGLVQLATDPHTFIVHRMYKGKRCTLIVPVYVDDLLPLGKKRYVEEFQPNPSRCPLWVMPHSSWEFRSSTSAENLRD